MDWDAAPATLRFIEEIALGDSMSLDVAAMAIAAHAYPGLDIDSEIDALDRIASHPILHADGFDALGLAQYLFATGEFVGNTAVYDDPRNSFLNDVLSRRLGIPITLAVVMMEVGRRVGISLVGIGMPGHFLVREARSAEHFFDPFNGGRQLDEDDCREHFHAIAGSDAPWHPAFLNPVGPREIILRMLTNIQQGALRRRMPEAIWSARLRLLIPGLAAQEIRQSADVLGGFGRHIEAARALEDLAAALPDDQAELIIIEANGWRAHAN
ncbi:unannotated protein [freshwater metagenome]|uniref:Unannotated protein n=1 Tax=freshwater metagenome TaxID=449393 RepID=A0A6J6X8X9_9ZZZZ|nr:hypothetical protein [Actinomycetota bacterium]